jgi:hypothetical protein
VHVDLEDIIVQFNRRVQIYRFWQTSQTERNMIFLIDRCSNILRQECNTEVGEYKAKYRNANK